MTELTTLLAAEPSRSAWLEVCGALEEKRDDEAQWHAALEMVKAALERWPERFRMAPLHWISLLVNEGLPVTALSVCSSLSLSPVLLPRMYKPMTSTLRPAYQKVVDWIGGLPADCPPLKGLHLGLRAHTVETIERVLKVAEDGERFVPQGRHYDSAFIKALLASPLASKLEVLDLSLDITRDEPPHGDSETLDGRGLRFDEVVGWLRAPQLLRCLDLHGQYVESGDLGSEHKRKRFKPKKMPNLTALNLGGGHPYNTADLGALKAALQASPLAFLDLAAGPVIDLRPTDEETELPDNADYWQVNDPEALRTTAASVEALAKKVPTLKQLVLSRAYFEDGDFDGLADRLGSSLALEKRSQYYDSEPTAPSALEQHLEL